MIDQNTQAIVIDNGSRTIKAGIAGDEMPKSEFLNIIGRPKIPGIIMAPEQREYFIGEEAQAKRYVLNLNHPIEHGFIINWDDMEKIWNHALYNKLAVQSEAHPVLLTDVPLNPISNREKMAQIMFESFNSPAFYVANQAVLSMHSSGKSTGIVVDSSDAATHAVPICEGLVLNHAVHRIDVAGIDLTLHLSRLINDKGLHFEQEIIQDIKEKLCYIALDVQEELDIARRFSEIERNYQMPDGATVTLGIERFKAPEALFNPRLLGLDTDGMGEAVYKSIIECDLSIRKDLYGHIVMSGGSTLYPGIAERLKKEISILAPANSILKVIASPERKYSAWIGGSLLSSLSSFEQIWITKAEYDDIGESIVRRKCF